MDFWEFTVTPGITVHMLHVSFLTGKEEFKSLQGGESLEFYIHNTCKTRHGTVEGGKGPICWDSLLKNATVLPVWLFLQEILPVVEH